MIQLVIRKIISNSWKVLCLLLGSILVVGMICSIPIYSNGILQRLLTKDLENYQISNDRYPGYMAISSNIGYSGQNSEEASRQMHEKMDGFIRQMPVAATLSEEIMLIENVYHTYEDEKGSHNRSFELGSLSSLADHVRIVKGRMSQPQLADGVMEVIASPSVLQNAYLVMDRVYEVYSYKQKTGDPSLLKVKVVGLYEPTETQDVYWYQHTNVYNQTLMADPALLADLSGKSEVLSIDKQTLFTAFDFYQFRIQDAGTIEKICLAGNEQIDKEILTSRFSTTFLSVIESYNEREAELKLTLQILIVPILLMLIFYIFMVSQLMIRSETTIISVLESRGAGRSRILLLYGLESLLLGAVTLVAGPLLGFWMVRVIGASNGFMEFVGRKALKIELDRQAILYGLAAVLLFLLTTLLPVFLQSRTSIVQQKRKKSRLARPPFWQRIFLDIILTGVSLYALYRLYAQVELQQMTGTGGIKMNLDFLLFLASTLFILGVGLLFLRLYPWTLRLVYLLGRRLWSPALFASFHQISRSDGQEQFLMIFLILSLSIGLFNANAARTINRNIEDSIRCRVGGDIHLQEYWQPYDKNGLPIIEGGMNFGSIPSYPLDQAKKYIEPNFKKYENLPGVEHAARVYRSDSIRISMTGTTREKINLMAVDPYDYALTAWSRGDLNRYHINEYMNVMSSLPNAVILSSSLRDKLKLKVGDGIIYTVNTVDNVDGVIVAFVDYWPGFQPQTLSSSGKVTDNNLIIASLEFVLSRSTIQPYEVWLKRADDATDKIIYEAIESAKINITSIESTSQTIARAKNDPQLQGTNGALTLGFIVSMLICAIGFLIYWIMALQGRVLQFGVFRAMGLGKGSVISMLLCEQGMVSGVAILFGIFLGGLSSKLFVPLFQLVYSSADQPLPFRVIALASDSHKIYLILGCLLVLCFAVLIRLTLRIRIDQAVKLGEE